MRKWSIVIILVVSALVALGAMNYEIQGRQEGTVKCLRAMAGEDPNTDIASAAITLATAGDWASRPTEANGLLVLTPGGGKQTPVRGIMFMACGRAAADKTFIVNYWVWFDQGPAKLAASVVYTLGTQKVVIYPRGATIADAYWADTAVVTSHWSLGFSASDNGADNGCAIVTFATVGITAIYPEVVNCDGTTGTEAAQAAVYWVGYN